MIKRFSPENLELDATQGASEISSKHLYPPVKRFIKG